MIATDEGALQADLAETYGIGIRENYQELPVDRLATLSFYLDENSRIKRKMNGMEYTLMEMMVATMADYIAIYVNKMLGSDEMPQLFTDILQGKGQNKAEEKNNNKKLETFETLEDFMKKWEG